MTDNSFFIIRKFLNSGHYFLLSFNSAIKAVTSLSVRRCESSQKLSLICTSSGADIEKYVGGKKGYKKNKYKYDERTVQLVQDNWNFALEQWKYDL